MLKIHKGVKSRSIKNMCLICDVEIIDGEVTALTPSKKMDYHLWIEVGEGGEEHILMSTEKPNGWDDRYDKFNTFYGEA